MLSGSGLPFTLVTSGQRLQFANAAPATRLGRTSVTVSADVFDLVHYGASLYDANAAIYTDGQRGAFVMDDGRLWPMSCAELLADNNSTMTWVSGATYGSYGVGPALYCLF